jgi:ribosome-binding protein aMBF1 (putative translation factor)
VAKALDNLKTHDELLAEQLASDPAFAREWERTAVARAVAIEVVRYRAEHGITQTELGRRLAMSQPQVARLEGGDHNPTIETMIRLVGTLGIELALDFAPAKKPKRELVSAKAQGSRSQSFDTEGVSVLVAAA